MRVPSHGTSVLAGGAVERLGQPEEAVMRFPLAALAVLALSLSSPFAQVGAGESVLSTVRLLRRFRISWLVRRKEIPMDQTEMAVILTDLSRERTELARQNNRLAKINNLLAFARTSLVAIGFTVAMFKLYYVP